MMKTTNCNIKHVKSYDVYCGRGKSGLVPENPHEYGWLGNPVKLNEICPMCQKTHTTRGLTLPCYKLYLIDKLKDAEWKKAFIDTCMNKRLGCWCLPKKCHTDIMIQALEELGIK